MTSNLFINGKDKTSGDFYNFSISLNNNIGDFNIEEGERLMVYPSRFSILNDFDNVNTYNNTFDIRVYNSSDILTETITVEVLEGIYNVYSFLDKLSETIELYLNSAGLSGDFTVSITYLEDTNKYRIEIINADFFNQGNTLTFYFSDIDSTLSQFIGYNSGEQTPTAIANGLRFTSSQGINMVFQPEIYIICNLVRKNYENTTDIVKPSNILLTIPQLSPKYSYIDFTNQSKLYYTESISPFSTVEINLVDHLGRDILFKSDCQLTLTFEKIKYEDKLQQLNNIAENIFRLQQLKTLATTLP